MLIYFRDDLIIFSNKQFLYLNLFLSLKSELYSFDESLRFLQDYKYSLVLLT